MKKLVFAFILIGLILFSNSLLYGQKILYPEIFPVNNCIDNFLTMYGAADQATITMMFDKKGFLWSGTETGLYRFDGVRYIEYRSITQDSMGYAGSIVLALFEDSDGIMWVGATGALNRLDKVTGRFSHYYPDPAGKIPVNNVIRLIREDMDKTLWIKTNGNIYSFNKSTFTFTEYKTPPSSWREAMDIYGEEPEKFLIDREGNIWSATDKGLYCIDHEERKLRIIIPSADDPGYDKFKSVCCITEDYSGNVWCGTVNGGLFRISTENLVPEKIDFDPGVKNRSYFPVVSALLHEKDGSLWIFGNNAFLHFNPSPGLSKTWLISYERTPESWLPRYNFIPGYVFIHPDSAIWMFWKNTGVMARFDRKTEKLSLYRIPYQLDFRCLMDSTGSFWVASVRNNIYRLSTGLMPYATIYVENGSWATSLASSKVAPGSDGYILAILTSGLYKIQIQDHFSSPQIEKPGIPVEDTIFSSVLTDTRMMLWLGGINGKIIRVNPSTGTSKIFRLEHPVINMYYENVPVLVQDNSGSIWAVTPRAGVYRFDETSDRFLHVFDFNNLVGTSSTFSDFLVSKNGEIWVTFIDRIFRVEPGNYRVSDYTLTSYVNNMMSGYYERIREDKKGNIWLLNSHMGLYLFDRTKDIFNLYIPPGEKLGSGSYDLLADSLGRLWVAHSKGITVIDPGKVESRLIRVNKPQFDIQGYEVPGHIVYINESEIYLFRHNIPVNNIAPAVYFTKLEVNGESFEKVTHATDEIGSLKELNLGYKQNSMRIEFTAINYNDAANNTYFYFMKGVDDDTISSGKENFAEYKKLKPGKYSFWVTAANNDGIRNKDGTNIIFNIKTPFYRSTLAYLFYATIVILTVLTYVRFKLKSIRKENIRLENEVNNRTAELKIKNRQLEEADRMNTKFFTDISHEIRTPLSLILGPLDSLIHENHYEPATENLLEMMRRNGQRLMQLVTQMLDISRLDSGKMKIVLSESDLTVFLRLLVYEFVSLAESKKIKYLVELPEKPHIVLFDEDKLEKILTNLLTNAFKFTDPGGTVRCSVRIIPTGPEGNTEEFVFTVADTGEGIESKNIDRIFERYYREEGEGDYSRDGTGVGLSLVKELVTLCHGKIEVTSRKGEGSLFEVTIPLGKDHLAADEFIIASAHLVKAESYEFQKWRDIEPAAGNIEQEHDRQRIIVIEDNNDLRNYLCANLEKDYSVISTENGKEGLNLCLTLVPDLVITDIMMKDLDGIALCEKLKNDERTSHIPVIMLTARSTMDDKIEGLKAGADDYLVKPFNLAELKARILNLMLQRDRLKHKYSYLLNVDLKENEKESVDDRFMRKVITILNENIHNFDFNVKVLQGKTGMSRTHLFRKLKVLTGLGPVTLIRKLRMEKAAMLLLNKSGNITEISNSVGISNPSYFTRCFKEHFGMTPKEYQVSKGV
jgi:signal transduction histidine kinase/DNA-binding response OmpR family regulator/ligand-binding sensor domain-containing protein